MNTVPPPPKGVFINVPTAISTEDHLMGFETLQTYTYDIITTPVEF